jgi:ABC-type transporter MlaC component
MPRNSTNVAAHFIPAEIRLAVFLLIVGLMATLAPADADSLAKTDLAESYIADVFRATVDTAVRPQSDEYATKAVKVLLLHEVPLDEAAHFMLGRALQTDNKQAAVRFQEEFHDLVAEAVARGLRANPTVALAVNGSHPRSDGGMLVLSTLSLPSGAAVPIDWQVVQDPAHGTFQITDITVAGMSVHVLLRSVAETMLADGQTGIDDLIPRLRHALARRSGETAANPR